MKRPWHAIVYFAYEEKPGIKRILGMTHPFPSQKKASEAGHELCERFERMAEIKDEIARSKPSHDGSGLRVCFQLIRPRLA